MGDKNTKITETRLRAIDVKPRTRARWRWEKLLSGGLSYGKSGKLQLMSQKVFVWVLHEVYHVTRSKVKFKFKVTIPLELVFLPFLKSIFALFTLKAGKWLVCLKLGNDIQIWPGRIFHIWLSCYVTWLWTSLVRNVVKRWNRYGGVDRSPRVWG